MAAAALIVLMAFSSEVQAQPSGLDIPVHADGPRRQIKPIDLIILRETGGMTGTGLSVSPDGNHLAFELHQADVEKNEYIAAWFVASTIGEIAPVNVGDAGDPTLFRLPWGPWIANYAKWSPDSRGIAYRKRLDDETQIWWSSRDGKESWQLSHNAADVEEFYWNRDGSLIFFDTDADRRELQAASDSRYSNGYVFDYDTNWSTINGRPSDPYPAYRLTGGKARVWALGVTSRVERVVTDDELAEYERLKHPDAPLQKSLGARSVAPTTDDSGVAWFQADDPDKQGVSPPLTLYASRAVDGSDAIRCRATECTGIMDLTRPLRAGLDLEVGTDEVFFVRKEGVGYSNRSLYGWRVGENHVRKVLTTDEWISDCSIVQNRAICFRETPSYPRTVVSIDLFDSSVQTLVDPNPEFRNIALGDVDLLEWENAHGYGTFGYLVKPPNYVSGQRYPLVIVGYRARRALRGGTGDEYPVHVLAANGFVVLVYEKPTTHGAFERYSDSIDLAKAAHGPDLFDVRMPLASFEAAIRILTDQGLVDPARVAVTGFSNGVGHVNYSLIHSDLFATAITSGSDFGPNARVLIGGSGEFFREYLRVIGAGPYPGPHAFLFPHLSLALNAERVTAPLLVNSSDAEHVQALEEVVALIEHDKPVEMIVYPDEVHNKWQPAHRASVYGRNVDWLNFWLQGVEDPSPEKVPQYERWHKLRELQEKSDRAAEFAPE